MFSGKEKHYIAGVVEKLLLSLNHPEMPKEKPLFKLHITGKNTWSWADVGPNWKYVMENSPRDNEHYNET